MIALEPAVPSLPRCGVRRFEHGAARAARKSRAQSSATLAHTSSETTHGVCGGVNLGRSASRAFLRHSSSARILASVSGVHR